MPSTKVVTIGSDQFVLLPPEFSAFGDEVEITREGDSVLLTPIHGISADTETEGRKHFAEKLGAHVGDKLT